MNRNSKISSSDYNDAPPWTHEMAIKRAKLLAAKRNVPVFLVPTIRDSGERAWAISFEGADEREAFAIQRELELKALHPEQSTIVSERRRGYSGGKYAIEPDSETEPDPEPEPELATGLSPPEWDVPTDAETDALDKNFD